VRKLLKTISRLSPYKATVLINRRVRHRQGSWSLARCIRSALYQGGRSLPSNCSNLVESLAESQLFGHVARRVLPTPREDSMGYFRSANGGTLFLDEIGRVCRFGLPAQAVARGSRNPRGSSRSDRRIVIRFDIRLVAATNRDLPRDG